ncbi:MAG TPA: class I SAM-dependent methyltransferase, partial [Anaerolineae bacterium]
LGAGNGWLANRLNQRGHQVAAVDISLDPLDGLAARARYENSFLTLQAEFDHLPLAPGQVDLVVYNGSFHYSCDYQTSLQAAFQSMKPDGQLVIMDSPLYHDNASGEAMVINKRAGFKTHYGYTSEALASQEFLTWQQLGELNQSVSCSWRMIWPVATWKRAWRMLKARFTIQREPAQFPIIAVTPHPVRKPSTVRHLIKRLWEPYLRLRYRWFYLPHASHTYVENVGGLLLRIYPQVFNPRLFRSGEIFAQHLDERLIPPGCSVLDLGTGSGIGAITAARHASRVVAVDINPAAVCCAQDNAILNQVKNRVEVHLGDLFSSLDAERFDVVLFNPPFLHGVPAQPFEQAFFSTDVALRFAAGLADHLKSGGYALLILSSMGETAIYLQALRWRGYRVRSLDECDLINERFTIYQVLPEARADQPAHAVPSAADNRLEGDDDHLI